MTDQASTSVGDATNASSGSIADVTLPKEEIVSYDTHRKLLSEKKKITDRVLELEKQAKDRDEAELKATNQYKTLYEAQVEANKQANDRLTQSERKWNDAIKLDHLMQAMGDRKIPSKFASYINLEGIVLDPETGKADPLTVEREVQRLNREFPEIIVGPAQTKNVLNDPPKSPFQQGSTTLKTMSAKERLASAALFLSKNQH